MMNPEREREAHLLRRVVRKVFGGERQLPPETWRRLRQALTLGFSPEALAEGLELGIYGSTEPFEPRSIKPDGQDPGIATREEVLAYQRENPPPRNSLGECVAIVLPPFIPSRRMFRS